MSSNLQTQHKRLKSLKSQKLLHLIPISYITGKSAWPQWERNRHRSAFSRTFTILLFRADLLLCLKNQSTHRRALISSPHWDGVFPEPPARNPLSNSPPLPHPRTRPSAPSPALTVQLLLCLPDQHRPSTTSTKPVRGKKEEVNIK